MAKSKKTKIHKKIDGQLLQMIDTEGHGLVTSAFDLDEQNTIRLSMPLMQHRRLINY